MNLGSLHLPMTWICADTPPWQPLKFWAEKLNQSVLVGYQTSKRGGIVACEILQDDRVLLRGNCVIMSEMLVDWEL